MAQFTVSALALMEEWIVDGGGGMSGPNSFIDAL